MQTVPMKLVTIVAEAVLEGRLLAMIREQGSTGHTISRVEGAGSRGVRASDFEGRNLKIETLVAPEVADRILDRLAERYFPHFAVVAYAADVEVVRGDKYARPDRS